MSKRKPQPEPERPDQARPTGPTPAEQPEQLQDDQDLTPADGGADAAEAPEADPGADLQRERDELMGRLQRVSADYLNYQKRVQRDVDQARQFANEELIKSLLGVVDNMERALAAAREHREGDDPLLTGMQLVHDSLLEVLGKFGLQRIAAEGETFDPERHAALMQQPSTDQPPMTVLQEIQAGYELKGRTLRPAQVVVAKAPDENDAAEG
jgi:molecular chaperone GrpE